LPRLNRDVLIGLLLLVALLGFLHLDPLGLARRIGYVGQDWLLATPIANTNTEAIVVVDIDRDSLKRHGPWPWPRSVIADLVSRIAGQSPKAIGIDIAFVGADRNSPAALARSLAQTTGEATFKTLAEKLVDGDKTLADALALGPSIFGLVAEPEAEGTQPPGLALDLENGRSAITPWMVQGVTGPDEPLLSAATGGGVLSLGSDEDGVVRSVPLLVLTKDAAYGSLPLEMLRMVAEVGNATLDGRSNALRLGGFEVALGQDALMLLRPSDRSQWAQRTVRASDVLAGTAASFAEKVVLIGGSAPELGVLRATAGDAATPSVQIQADALAQLLADDLPQPVLSQPLALFLACAGLGLAGFALALWLSPFAGLAGTLFVAGCWLAAMQMLLREAGLVLPLLPVVPLLVSFFVLALLRFIRTFWQERTLRARFAERLAPGVVDRIVANPALLKVEGAQRDITVLFTDIEGFTALTERLDPREVIALLDRYMERVGGIVVEHGGMIDKIVGDAVHAIFNAPLDLDDHATRAIRCAKAILAATIALENEPEIVGFGLGRTRIGIETGTAVVGDVGGKVRLDYTAHGHVINTAARLEAANKELGSSICIGPIAAERQQGIVLRSLGTVEVRGLSQPLSVFTPGD
jgi:adenylate cyclase